MKYNTTSPIYLQIIYHIKKDIVTGVLMRGEKIESVRALAEKFDVNLNTMHRACIELERQGVIYTQRGVGNFVTEDNLVIDTLKKEMSDQLLHDFISGMKNIGYNENGILEIIKKEL